MKRYIKLWIAALCTIVFVACSNYDELTQTKITSNNISVAAFPSFGTSGIEARSNVGKFDSGKKGWIVNDEILLKITDATSGALVGKSTLKYDGVNWNWSEPILQTEATTANVTAYYAPAYKWSDNNGGTLTLKSGKSAGTDEYLKYNVSNVSLADGINIDFRDTRAYSRLRIATIAGKNVSLTCSGFTTNDGGTTAATVLTTTADNNGNAYFYGTWKANAMLAVSVNSTPTINVYKTITDASINSKSYVLEACASMRFTIRTAAADTKVNMPFYESNKTPKFDITVDWGDGTTATIESETALNKYDAFSHVYTVPGDYTMSVNSAQTDDTKQQVPSLAFYSYHLNDSILELISLDTPLLNTADTSFNNYFSNCRSLKTISAGLFDKNTAVKDFSYCFMECYNLSAIPAGLFDKNTAATVFNSCFYNCSNLSKIPARLFYKNIVADNFSSCFFKCSNLSEIPTGLFDKNTVATDFSNCFNSCSNLNTIPSGLFDKNTAALRFFGSFGNCANLREVPAGLFAKNTVAWDFRNCFWYCPKLRLNSDIFIDGINTTKNNRFANLKSLYFTECFASCGLELKEGEGGTAPDLWFYPFTPGVNINFDCAGCFYDVTKVTNAKNIPEKWKDRDY